MGVPPYSKYNKPPGRGPMKFGKSRTRQSEKAACDVNNIMKKYKKTGIIPVKMRQAFYADVSEIGDYRGVCDRINEATAFFNQQPAQLRARFDNDPALFLDFCSKEENRDEMVDLGLLPKPGKEEPAPEAPEASKNDGSDSDPASPVNDA